MVFSVHYYTHTHTHLHTYTLTHLHTDRLSDFINILVDPLCQRESSEEDIFQIWLLCKNSFWIVAFNIFPTILGQRTKIENFVFFRKFSKSRKSPLRAKFFKFYFFSQNFLQESRFPHISDLFRQRKKIEILTSLMTS